MEQGQVLASDILPKVAKEMSRVANSGGALEEKYKTARVAQGRFFNQLEQAQNTLFQGGMDEGIGSFFNDLAHSLRELEPMLSVIGKVFKVAFTLIGSTIRLVTVPFQILGRLLKTLTDLFGEFSEIIIIGLGAAFIAKMSLITKAVAAMGVAFSTLAFKITTVLASLLLLEDVWMSFNDSTANTVTNRLAGYVDEKGMATQRGQSLKDTNMLTRAANYAGYLSGQAQRAVFGKSFGDVVGGGQTVNVTIAADSQGLIKVVDQQVQRQFSFAEAVSN